MEAAYKNYLLLEGRMRRTCGLKTLFYIVVHPQDRVIRNAGNNLHLRAELAKIESIDANDLAGIEKEDIKMENLLQVYEIVLKEFDQYYGTNFRNAL